VSGHACLHSSVHSGAIFGKHHLHGTYSRLPNNRHNNIDARSIKCFMIASSLPLQNSINGEHRGCVFPASLKRSL